MATIARSQAAGFTDYGAEAEDIARRRKMAEMMQMQALEPIKQETAGGYVVPISWTQGLAKALQAGVGGYQQGQLKDEARQLADRRNQALAQAISGMPQATTETAPGPDDGSGIPSPNVTTTKQPTWQQQAGWLGNLAQVGPDAVAIGSTVLGMRQKEQENEANREARTLDRIMTLEARAQDRAMTLEARAEAQRAAEAMRRDLAAQQDELRRDLAGQSGELRRELHAAAGANQPITAVTLQDPQDPNKTVVVDGRTGRVIGPGPKPSAVGAIEQKLEQSLPQAKLRVESMSQNLDRLESAMQELDKNPGLSNITGTFMGRTPNLTNKATGAQAQLNSIKSQIFQSSLQAMREASKTGGAVGNVSDREGDKLERTLAALDQAQGTADFKKQLAKAVEQVRLSRELIRNAYNEQFSGIQSRGGSTVNPAAPAAQGGWGIKPLP